MREVSRVSKYIEYLESTIKELKNEEDDNDNEPESSVRPSDINKRLQEKEKQAQQPYLLCLFLYIRTNNDSI